MLLQFTFKNFRSFKDENILDMRATKVTELSYHVRKIGNDKILPITAVYGANASGKSNVIHALGFMRMCITTSMIFNTDIDNSKLKFPYGDNIKFCFTDNNDEVSSYFETIFILKNKKRYSYGFIIDKNGFKEEWLKLIKSNNEYTDIVIRKNYKLTTYKTRNIKMDENIKTSLNHTSLVLTLGAMLNDKLLIEIRNWFNNMNIVDFGNPIIDTVISKNIVSNELINGKLKTSFLNYLASFDNSIIDYTIKKQANEENEKNSYKIYTHHKIIGSNDIKKIPLSLESSGTQKMITLFIHFYKAIQNGTLIFIDELNAKLHPLLVRLILNMFSNPETNPNNAQLIFTTHDTWLMHKDILRRDEIWFTDKNKDGISELYSFVEFKDDKGKGIRNDENYEKNYLLGKYGAIPSLKFMNILEQDSENEI